MQGVRKSRMQLGQTEREGWTYNNLVNIYIGKREEVTATG